MIRRLSSRRSAAYRDNEAACNLSRSQRVAASLLLSSCEGAAGDDLCSGVHRSGLQGRLLWVSQHPTRRLRRVLQRVWSRILLLARLQAAILHQGCDTLGKALLQTAPASLELVHAEQPALLLVGPQPRRPRSRSGAALRRSSPPTRYTVLLRWRTDEHMRRRRTAAGRLLLLRA